MKRINEILKSLNFPKFYEKCKGEVGETLFMFDNFTVREYDYNDNKLFLESLPFTEATIHPDDVEFIIQYLAYCVSNPCWVNDVKNYVVKLLDNYTYNRNGIIGDIVRSLGVNFYTKTGLLDFPSKQETCCKNEVPEKLLNPMVEMLENIAGSMLKTIEQKEYNRGVSTTEDNLAPGTYVLKQGENGIKVERTEAETDESKIKIPRCEKFDYNRKNPTHMTLALGLIPFQEKDINKKDIKFIQKFMKDCLKTAKTSKKFKKTLTEFLLKVVDSTTFGVESPKIQKTFNNPKLGKLVMKQLDKEDGLSGFEQDDRIRRLEKENKKLNKRLKKAKK